MLRVYMTVSLCVIGMLGMQGCSSKDTIPPAPPKNENTQIKEERTLAEMQRKLARIRNPIEGEALYAQKRDAKHEIDTLLGDAKRYKGKLSRFEKAQLDALKNAKRSYRHKLKKQHRKLAKKSLVIYKKNKETIDMVNEYENKLKYY